MTATGLPPIDVPAAVPPRQTLAMRLAERERQRAERAERLARLRPASPAAHAAPTPDDAEAALEEFLRALTGAAAGTRRGTQLCRRLRGQICGGAGLPAPGDGPRGGVRGGDADRPRPAARRRPRPDRRAAPGRDRPPRRHRAARARGARRPARADRPAGPGRGLGRHRPRGRRSPDLKPGLRSPAVFPPDRPAGRSAGAAAIRSRPFPYRPEFG